MFLFIWSSLHTFQHVIKSHLVKCRPILINKVKINEREEEMAITIVTVDLKFKIKKLKVKKLYQ